LVSKTQRVRPLRLRQLLVGLFLLSVFVTVETKLLFAQSQGGAPTAQRNSGVNSEPGQPTDMATNHNDVSDKDLGPVAAQLTLKPPLPFTSPQVGPLIKRAYEDDVERRTTAFQPQALEHLTPVEMPDEERWIRVDLSEQIVIAYEGAKPVRAFVISSGLPGTPTVTGEFRIRTKVSEQVMSGGVGSNAYYLPGVKWVQYFYEEYSFHGTYWHNNFGNPMSHGCLNMTNADAKWLFDWAGPVWDGKTTWYKSSAENPGTLVIITH
jgi:lipoprotein-anchoring transpeptidase ErfK/SrfK